MSLHETDTPLCPAFNRLLLQIAAEVMPQGYDVRPDAPDTLEDLKDYHARTGKVAVNSENRHGLVVGDPEPYYAFRAWHDLLHVEVDKGEKWSIPGEQLVSDCHRLELLKRVPDRRTASFYADLIEVEVVAANHVYVKTGQWPSDERMFALAWLCGRGWTVDDIETFCAA